MSCHGSWTLLSLAFTYSYLSASRRGLAAPPRTEPEPAFCFLRGSPAEQPASHSRRRVGLLGDGEAGAREIPVPVVLPVSVSVPVPVPVVGLLWLDVERAALDDLSPSCRRSSSILSSMAVSCSARLGFPPRAPLLDDAADELPVVASAPAPTPAVTAEASATATRACSKRTRKGRPSRGLPSNADFAASACARVANSTKLNPRGSPRIGPLWCHMN